MIHGAAELGVADQLAARKRLVPPGSEQLARPVALLCGLGYESEKTQSHPGVQDPTAYDTQPKKQGKHKMDNPSEVPGEIRSDDLQAHIQRTLVKTFIALPLLKKMAGADASRQFDVIIDANLDYPGARVAAREWILKTLAYLIGESHQTARQLKPLKNRDQPHYVFARLSALEIRDLVDLDGRTNAELEQRMHSDQAEKKPGPTAGISLPLNEESAEATKDPNYWVPRAVYQIWEDFKVYPLLFQTLATCKADAARAAFRASGQDICWAVIDSGIDQTHPHFAKHQNLKGSHAQWHRDFNDDISNPGESALRDEYGHGTHVAGIIAGGLLSVGGEGGPDLLAMAPRARIVSYKVLADNGSGYDAWIIKAIDHIWKQNQDGRRLAIQGVNLSLGGAFDPASFGCGDSPLCASLLRLVRQGVLVVLAAGNEGSGDIVVDGLSATRSFDLSIGDPANLEEAIAVGSVHPTLPHRYGTSYFSSRGPTADGRLKPDVVGPGERILSCRSSGKGKGLDDLYVALSGTSMAAPHISGLLAAFLSVRKEFIGYPERVKRILLEHCTDLQRDRYHQGAGLPNLAKMLLET
jgi:hypothetical protein